MFIVLGTDGEFSRSTHGLGRSFRGSSSTGRRSQRPSRSISHSNDPLDDPEIVTPQLPVQPGHQVASTSFSLLPLLIRGGRRPALQPISELVFGVLGLGKTDSRQELEDIGTLQPRQRDGVVLGVALGFLAEALVPEADVVCQFLQPLGTVLEDLEHFSCQLGCVLVLVVAVPSGGNHRRLLVVYGWAVWRAPVVPCIFYRLRCVLLLMTLVPFWSVRWRVEPHLLLGSTRLLRGLLLMVVVWANWRTPAIGCVSYRLSCVLLLVVLVPFSSVRRWLSVAWAVSRTPFSLGLLRPRPCDVKLPRVDHLPQRTRCVFYSYR